ncbi:MAG: tRNA 4-thiouridine(8) synthase ThiI [Bacilli bacterium]|nr:tRNA 4-thiouridine(8) synthase ThiI [Bacilli bacterium]
MKGDKRMITYDHIMVRFGELGTKGKNKKDFIRMLGKNIRRRLIDFPNVSTEVRYDHIYIKLNGEEAEEIIEALQDVSGIQTLSLVYKCEKDIDVIISSALELISQTEGKTFKVKCKRSDKSFPLNSDEIVRKVAPAILKTDKYKVDIHNPDILVSIEIRDEGAYIFTKSFPGAGGYPLGVAGKGMLMLSGGIDSPVAAYLLMKRGVKIECIHFASPPYTNIGVIYKLEDLLAKLNVYQPRIRLHIVPFTKIQEAIYDHAPESYCITIMRRMMYRLATRLAYTRNCPVIANGESIGQVASQTLQSMKVINEVSDLPVIRPLATMDKIDIIKIAKKIDTFEISIRPFEDCCTIFTPKRPKTMPHIESVEQYEKSFDYESLLKEALNNIEVKYIGEE